MKKIAEFKKGVTVLALLAMAAAPAIAQDNAVTLRSTDGTVEISGQLKSFENGAYTLVTRLGELQIDASNLVCDGPGCPVMAAASINIVGSDTIGLEMMPLLLTGYANNIDGSLDIKQGNNGTTTVSVVAQSGFGDPVADFFVNPTTSGEGFRALLDRNVHISMASRRIRPNEARRLRDRGAGNMIANDQEHIVAVDSLAVIVHPDNPVTGLSLRQLDGIYSGAIRNWSQVGGPNRPIKAYGRGADSGTGAVFGEKIFSETGNRFADSVTAVHSNPDMSLAVARDPDAIGFVGLAYVRGVKPLNIVGQCGIISRPDLFSSKTEEYPLERRLYLYNRADNVSEEVRDFIRYATSAEADGVIAKSGFIDLGIISTKMDNTDGRMRDLIQSTTDPFELGLMREFLVDMLQWERLSTTFRFASGSSRLDAKALIDLDRLTAYLDELPPNSEIALVGFTDSDGAFGANQALSIQRAARVAEALQNYAGTRLNGVRVVSKGYGEMAPVACNDTLDGKRINRRVEVWVRSAS